MKNPLDEVAAMKKENGIAWEKVYAGGGGRDNLSHHQKMNWEHLAEQLAARLDAVQKAGSISVYHEKITDAICTQFHLTPEAAYRLPDLVRVEREKLAALKFATS